MYIVINYLRVLEIINTYGVFILALVAKPFFLGFCVPATNTGISL